MSSAKGEALRGKTSPRHVLDVLIKERADDDPRTRHRRRNSREVQTQVLIGRIDLRSRSILQRRTAAGENDRLGPPLTLAGKTIAFARFAVGVADGAQVLEIGGLVPLPACGARRGDELPGDAVVHFRKVPGPGGAANQIGKANFLPMPIKKLERFLVMGTDGVRLNSGGQGQVRKSHSANLPETSVRSQHAFAPQMSPTLQSATYPAYPYFSYPSVRVSTYPIW